MKHLYNFICLLGIQAFLPLNASELPQRSKDVDSTVVILFEKDTIMIPPTDTIRFSKKKNVKPDSVVIVFEKDSLLVLSGDIINLTYSKTTTPDTLLFRYKRKIFKLPLQDTITIKDENSFKIDPTVVLLWKDTVYTTPEYVVRVSKNFDKGKARPLTYGKLEFRGKLFTDFVGINIDQPNGLIQTNGYFCYTFPHINKIFIPFKNWVLADFTYSKIEDRNKLLPVRYSNPNNPDSLKAFFNRLDLYQYAYFRTATKINLFTINCRQAFSIYTDVLATFYGTYIDDTMKISSAKSVTSIAIGYNIKMITTLDKKSLYTAEIAYSHLWPKLYSNFYEETARDQYNNYNGVISGELHAKNSGFTGIGILDLTLAHNVDNKENRAQFLRVSIACNNLIGKDIPKNIFFQLQLGFTINIKEFISESDKSEKST
jgi:hypothetical protein